MTDVQSGEPTEWYVLVLIIVIVVLFIRNTKTCNNGICLLTHSIFYSILRTTGRNTPRTLSQSIPIKMTALRRSNSSRSLAPTCVPFTARGWDSLSPFSFGSPLLPSWERFVKHSVSRTKKSGRPTLPVSVAPSLCDFCSDPCATSLDREFYCT